MKNIFKRTLQIVVVASGAALLLIGVVFVRSQGASADTTLIPPAISGIISTPSNNGAVIQWTTDQAASSQVVYGTTTSYGSFSTLDANNVTSHSVSLTSLEPNTTYHFIVFSSLNASTTGSSTDMFFTTASTTDNTAPLISAVFATPTSNSATITWTTNEPATSRIQYGLTTGYGSQTTLNTTSVTSHSVLVSGLTPSTLYHFRILSGDISGNNATSTDYWFTTTSTGGTGTTTEQLDTRVTNLETRVGTLEAALQNILNILNDDEDTGSTTPSHEPAFITTNPQVRAGTNTDFGGSNFGSEEHVRVTLGGIQVASGLTNLAGGFSTGSVTVPTTTGTYTYTFTGLSSGKSATATITVIP
jgi:hypothetical protein